MPPPACRLVASPSPSPRLGLLLALATAFLWGTMPIAGKLALQGFGPLAITALRFLGGALVLGGFLAWRGRPTLAALRERPVVTLLAGVGLTGNYILYIVGLQYTAQTAAQLVVQLANVFFLAWGVLFFGEKLTRIRVGGITLAILGVALVTWNGESWETLRESASLRGNLLVAAAALSWSGYAALQKLVNRTHASFVVLTGVLAAGALYTAPALGGVTAAGAAGALAIAALLYLILNTVAAYGSFAESLQHMDAGQVSVILAFAPVVTVILTAIQQAIWPHLVAEDALTPWTLAGTVLVVAGIVLVVRGGRVPHRPPRGAAPE